MREGSADKARTANQNLDHLGPAKIGAHNCEQCDVRSFGICTALSGPELDRLQSLASTRVFQAGETIFSAEDPATIAGSVVKGTIKTYKLLPDGRQQVVGFLFPGDFLGSASFTTNRCFAEALTQVTACVFPHVAFRRLLADMPTLEHQLLKLAHDDLDLAQEWMLLLGRKTARERIATFLLLLSDKARGRGHGQGTVELPMNRSEIADYLGLTIETVSRQLSKLKSAKIISIGNVHEIEVRNREALAALAEGID